MDAEQAAAVGTDAPCVLVRACPGSGKTRVLTNRARRLRGGSVVCLSFTNQAAEEMRRRLGDTAVHCGTMHSFAKERLPPPVRLLDVEGQRRVFADLGAVGPDFEAAVRSYGLCAARSLSRDYDGPHRDLLRAYDAAKREAGVLDFEDLLTGLCELDPEDPPAHVLVDEFQDLNPVQIEILRRMRARGSHVFCVGDGNQAIYGFRGATPDCMARFEELMGCPATRLDLHRNYRSSPPVVALCSRHGGVRMVSCRPGGDDGGPKPELHLFARAAEEAAWLAGRSGVALFRTNTQLRAVEAELLQAGVGSAVVGAPGIREQDVWAALGDAVREHGPASWEAATVDDLTERLPVPKEETRAARPLMRKLCKLGHAEAAALLAGEPAAGWVLSTVHQAKGMEWPSVHLPGLVEGQFPLRAQSPEEAAEERRIFFVAATRAMSGLVLSCSGDRPSEFLRGLPVEDMRIVDHRGGGDPPPPPETARYRRRKKR